MMLMGFNDETFENARNSITEQLDPDFKNVEKSILDLTAEAMSAAYGVDIHILRKPMSKLSFEEFNQFQDGVAKAVKFGFLE